MTEEPNRSAQVWGAARELLAATGGALVAYGVAREEVVMSILGAILAVGAVAEGLHRHDGNQQLLTLVRKAVSAVGGALVAIGVVADAEAQAIIGVLVPAISLVWSLRVNGRKPEDRSPDYYQTPD